MFAAAGFFALMALIMLSVAIAYFINWNGHGLSLHWAFLIVFGFYLLVAALLAFIGIRKVKKVRAPEKAIAQANEAKQILRRGPSDTAKP
jgi:high-affinity Fe2+/Pb2+ permease